MLFDLDDEAVVNFVCSIRRDCNFECNHQAAFYIEEASDPSGDGNGNFPRLCDWLRQDG